MDTAYSAGWALGAHEVVSCLPCMLYSHHLGKNKVFETVFSLGNAVCR